MLSRLAKSSGRFTAAAPARILPALRPLTQLIPTTAIRNMTTDLQAMRGVIIEKNGGPEVLQYKTDLPVPEAKAGEVLVKNEYIGINFIDTGSYAEYSAVAASHAIKTPAAVSSEAAAAAAMFQGLTALTLVREAHRVEAGDWVLVHAAAGGVGLWLCQLLGALGARVVATASTPEKLALAGRHGAEVLVRYTEEDVVAKVKEVTGGEGVAAVFDGVGKTTFDVSMECVRRKGSLVCFGNASGPVPPVNILRLMDKNVKLLRTNLARYITTRDEFQHYGNELLELMTKFNLDARIHEIYPLAEVARAHQDIESRKTSGKLLLKVEE
ncbi:NADPH:quinone reductase [Neofusicoccum ribis]|uniref:NADPH:quinone reductase n=1 Tax=Neofusicoccum ribis TaxID=45134 RepID=A0ABR3SN34_9PEZI